MNDTHTKQLQELGRAVAECLPDGWQYDDHTRRSNRDYRHNAWIFGPDDMAISLFWPRYVDKRVEIRGSHPRPFDGSYIVDHVAQRLGGIDANPKIGVSADRGAAAVAKDIERRLLPKYRILFEAVRAEVAATNEAHEKAVKQCGEVAETLGQEFSYERNGHRSYDVSFHGDIHGHITPYLDGTMSVKLSSVPDTIALPLLAKVRAHNDTHKE